MWGCSKAAEVVWRGSCSWRKVGNELMGPFDNGLAILVSQVETVGGECPGIGHSQVAESVAKL